MGTPVKFSKELLTEAIYKNLKAIVVDCEQYTLAVGIPGTEVTKVSKSATKKGEVPANIAYYAYLNEFGSKSNKIPSRPFMRSTFKGEILKKIERAANKIFTEIAATNKGAREALNKFGLIISGYIKLNISQGEFKPNSSYTLAHKKGDRPLIDTGSMRRAITSWVIGKQGK